MMKTIYRTYCIYVNGESLKRHVSIEAISEAYLKKNMQYHKKKIIENGVAKENDQITFVFKHSYSE